MKELLLAALAAWLQAYRAEPLYTTLAGVGAAVLALVWVSKGIRARLHARTGVAAGPLLLVAGLAVCFLSLLWSAIDGLLLWADAPLVSERLLGLLAPADQGRAGSAPAALAQVLGVADPRGLRLPGGVAMTLGLLAAVAAYGLIAWLLQNTLAELLALQSKPEDVLRAEEQRRLAAEARERAARQARQARQAQGVAAAGEGEPGDGAADTAGGDSDDRDDSDESAGPDAAPAVAPGGEAERAATRPAVPLPDDRLGRLYKLAGHFHDHAHVEPRFLRWHIALSRSLVSLAGVGAALAATGFMPVPLWVGVAVLAGATRQLATVARPRPHAGRPAARPEDARADAPAGPPAPAPPGFAERDEVAPHLVAAPEPPEPPEPGPAAPPPSAATAARGVLPDVLAALGVSRLYPHQAEALAALDGGVSVLLCTPPMSGRQLVTDALALSLVLGRGRGVLHIGADPAACAAAKARFDARAEATHWKWNILAANLADRAGALDPGRSQPALVFADPEAVHRRLCGQSDRWETFLAGLDAVIVPDVHAYSGAPAAHLAHVLRRLERAVRRARSPAAGHALLCPRDAGPAVRAVLTARPGHAHLGRYAERILGQPVRVIGPAHDGAPRPRQACRVVSPAWDPGGAHPALGLRDMAARLGYRAALHGYEVLAGPERAPGATGEDPAGQADVVIARLSAATCASLPVTTRHLGARRPPGRPPSVAVLWQPDPTPLARRLAARRPAVAGDAPPQARPEAPDAGPAPEWADLGAHLGPGRALVAWPGAPAVERDHLRATLAEAEVSEAELRAVFSRAAVDAELDRLRSQGRLIERERRLLDVRAGAVKSARTLRLATSEDVHAGWGLGTTSRPWHICERATGRTLAAVEGERALAAGHAGRVLVARGRRFAVLGQGEQTQLEHGRILAEPVDAPVMTAPIRTLVVELIERRKRAGEPAVERRRGGLRSLGGARFSLEHRDAVITETVLGVRRFDLRGRPLDTTLYDQPVTATFASRVAVLGFVAGELPAALGEVSIDTLHGLAHGFAESLGGLVAHGPDDLDIAPLAESPTWSVPALVFVDLHPGGAGFADAVTLDGIRAMARCTLALVRACPEDCERGCAACLHTWTCRAPAEHHQRVDKAGAGALLSALLGA